MADETSKDSDTPANQNQTNKGRRRIYGLCLMSLSGFYVVLANTLVQLIHVYSNTDISSLTMLFSRSVVTVAMALLFMAIARINPFPSKRETLALCALGLTGVVAALFTYLALSLIPVGDVTVLQCTTPIFTSVMGCVFLDQPCSLIDAFLGFISFCGVFIVTRPVIIFGHQETDIEHICKSLIGCENEVKSIDHAGSNTYIYGVGYTLVGAFIVSFFFILNKLTSRDTDVILTLFYTGVMGMIIPTIIAFAKEDPYRFGSEWEIWLLLFLIGVLSVVHLLFFAESLQFEDAGPAALIRNADCVYAFGLQYGVLGITPHALTIIGAAIVVVSATAMGIARYMSARNVK